MERHPRRFTLYAAFGLAAAAVMTFGLSGVAVAGTSLPTFDTDHFMCYEATDRNPNAPITISLDDQFCAAGNDFCLAGVTASTVLEFCNPARKVHGAFSTGIQEPDLHLTFYELTQRLPSARKKVAVSNQFNNGLEQVLRVSAPKIVAVPTLKNRTGSVNNLNNLNHFTCYEASGKRILEEVDVQDQFRTGLETILVHGPKFMCNPTTKRRSGQQDSDVPEPNDHLVCYKVTPSDNPTFSSVEANNQFEGLILTAPETFDIGPLHFLCVPSTKRVL